MIDILKHNNQMKIQILTNNIVIILLITVLTSCSHVLNTEYRTRENNYSSPVYSNYIRKDLEEQLQKSIDDRLILFFDLFSLKGNDIIVNGEKLEFVDEYSGDFCVNKVFVDVPRDEKSIVKIGSFRYVIYPRNLRTNHFSIQSVTFSNRQFLDLRVVYFNDFCDYSECTKREGDKILTLLRKPIYGKQLPQKTDTIPSL
ncbi:MAG: hypothetical protein C4K58_05965 [Flavobacteriaceae bacterium]|nr:MAG: hypothetical protein C4K58_05965 [Flavobacteriaceae bacterium]